MRSIRWTLAVLAAFFLFAGAAQASTITVSVTDDPVGAGSCPAGPCSLRQAIASASANDVIQLGGTAQDPNVYTLTQGTTILVSQNLTIVGNGPGATIVDGIGNLASDSQPVRIFKVTAGTVSFDSLAMRNGGDSHDENDFPGPDPTLTLNGGGALFVQAGTVTLDTVGFQDNRAPTGGAVSINSGTLTMSDTWFRQSGGAIGGALFVRGGTVTGSRLTFEANGTGAFGGGAAFLYGGAMTLTNSTIAGNGSASSFGGGIANDAGTLTLQNDTFKNNARGALQTDSGATTSAENTIFGSGFASTSDFACIAAGKNAVSNKQTVKAITTDLGNNLDEDGSCQLVAVGDVSNGNAKLAPIGDNGGPTRTMALLAGSGALGAANDDCPLIDQRGVARPGTNCDIGAFEATALGLPTATTGAPINVSANEETLSGAIDLSGEAGGYHFVWGTAADQLTNTTPELAAGVVSTNTGFSGDLSNLNPATTYYYAIVADNSSGSATAANVETFTTPAGPPTVSNVSVGEVTDTTAVIDFTVDPDGGDTTYVVKYGPTSGYGQTTDPVDIGATAGDQALETTLTGLTPGTGYHFDVVATNDAAPLGVDSGDGVFATQGQFTALAGSPATLEDSGDFGSCPTATIDWGDGSPTSSGTVGCTDDGFDGSNFTTTGHHTYAAPGHYEVHVDYGGAGPASRLWALITPAPPRTLSVTLGGTGSGSVSGDGISCPGTCSKQYTNGSSVTLHAPAGDGSSFSGWSGDCSGTGDCTLTMGGDHAVTATFTANPAPQPIEQTPPIVPAPQQPAAPKVPLILTCSRAPLILLDVHFEGGKVVVAGLALPKFAGDTVTIKPSSKKARPGTTTVHKDGTFAATLAAPPKKLRGSIRYQAVLGSNHSAALKLSRRLVIKSEKVVAGGLRITGDVAGAGKGASVSVTRQVSCSKREVFATIKTGAHGAFAVTLPAPTGGDSLAFYRLNTSTRGGTTDSLPVTVRAPGA